MGRNEDKLRAAEENWLDPDYPTYISHEAEGDFSLKVGVCHFCSEADMAENMIEIDGRYICIDCAERILEKWEEMGC